MRRSRCLPPDPVLVWLAMNLLWQGKIWPPPQAAATFDHALNPTVGRVVVCRPLISLMLFPFPAPLLIRNVAVRGSKDAITALSIDGSLAVLRNPQPVRIDIRAAVGGESDAILVHENIGDLRPIGEVSALPHPVDKECKGITWICINLSKVEDGLNLLVINLSPRVIRGQSFEGFITAIPCHHVEARGPAVVDVCRRVIQVVRKEPLYKSLIEE